VQVNTDRYTKIVLTIIAVTLVLLLFKPQVQQSLTPTSAYALSQIPEVKNDQGQSIMLEDVFVRNTDGVPVPVKETGKIEVYWTKPMPVYLTDTAKMK
jgi:hypothetical protein